MSDFTALNLAILFGLAIMGATVYVWARDNSRMEKENERQGEINRALWNQAQREIDAYRVGADVADVADDYEKAGERE